MTLPRTPEILTDLEAKLEELLTGSQIPAGQARELSRSIVRMIGTEWAGQQIYIGKGIVYEERDRDIYRSFTGANHADLARRYNLTERQIYSIIEKERTAEMERRQPRLFPI